MVIDWDSFKNSIEDTFYNDTIDIYKVEDIMDSLGATINTSAVPYELGVKCNIQNNAGDIVNKESGMEMDAKYRISLPNSVTFDKDNKYIARISSSQKVLDNLIQYEVKSIQPFNTYVLLFLEEVDTQYYIKELEEDDGRKN